MRRYTALIPVEDADNTIPHTTFTAVSKHPLAGLDLNTGNQRTLNVSSHEKCFTNKM